MDSLNMIRSRIRAVSETSKITNAMKLVSSSRVKRILRTLSYNDRYYQTITRAMGEIISSGASGGMCHPYYSGHFHRREGRVLPAREPSRAYMVFAGERGMVGAYNRSILDFAWNEISAQNEPSLITVGSFTRKYFARKQLRTSGYLLRFPLDVTLHNARNMAAAVKDLYDHSYIDELYIIRAPFFGQNRGKPVSAQLLPISSSDLLPAEAPAPREMIYIPSEIEALEQLIPQFIVSILFEALVQTYAGEQFARMNAMEAATRNADEILKKLRLEYNLARQAAITNEIAEISAASLHMEED